MLDHGQPGRGRIIPARAGFTPRPTRCSPIPRDHPRSRGVYEVYSRGGADRRGSSPLARGLHPRLVGTRIRIRIIPARAGFTSPPTTSATPSSDHPRSRGVYGSAAGRCGRIRGSSPLARGLRARPHAPRRPRGIIPARAGFTPRGRAAGQRPEDHPRSRGVYARPMRANRSRAGSSPLARGLPETGPERVPDVRIIPARAGFTHPEKIIETTAVGSSPLARGLREELAAEMGVTRIIPARAGFTNFCLS